jgi:hypothetical protein
VKDKQEDEEPKRIDNYFLYQKAIRGFRPIKFRRKVIGDKQKN